MTDQLIAEAGPENTIVINTGDNFQDTGEVEKKKAEVLFNAFAMIGIDCICLGDREFVFGAPFLGHLASRWPVNLVCTNLEGAGRESPHIVPYLRLNKGNIQVLITSVIDPLLLKSTGEKIAFTDPVTAIKRVREAISHDLFIVICHAKSAIAEKWLAQVSGINLAILGHQTGVGKEKTEINGAVVVFNNDRGQIVAHVDLMPRKGSYQVGGPQNTVLHVEEIAEDPMVSRLIEQYEAWSRKHYYEKSKDQRSGKVGRCQGNIYAGKDGCKECHQEKVTSWAKTAHARALASLIRKGKEYDPKCLPCHVTGMRDGGFVSLDSTPHMANVQCEACHGPAGLHAGDPYYVYDQQAGVQTCQRCHTKETDPDFVFGKKRQKGVHQ